MLAFIVETTKPPAYPFIIINVKERDPQTQNTPISSNFAEPIDRVSSGSHHNINNRSRPFLLR